MSFDLHVHSAASDGHFSAEQLVRVSLSLKLEAIAITDHDSVDGVLPAIQAAHGTGLMVIPGVELSASWNGVDVHILGYFIDPHDHALNRRLAALREERISRAGRIVNQLHSAGIELTLDEVMHSAGRGSVGRSHVARALVSRGHVTTVMAAFEELLGQGRPYYLPKPEAHPVDVIRSIIKAGGVPVLAHPGITRVDDSVPLLAQAGLGGLEAYHGEHTPIQRKHYIDLAREHDLIVTGGSDFHGPGAPGSPLGGVEMPRSLLRDLLKSAGRAPVEW